MGLKRLSVVLLLLIFSTGVAYAAEGIKLERLGYGLGFGTAEVPEFTEGKSAIQIYASYRTDGLYGLSSENYSLSAELGYVDVSDVEHDGFWLTPVVAFHANDLVDILLRLGIEYGDDLGAVYGVGISYQLERNMAMRLEYVERANANTFQVNVIYYPWSMPF